MSLTAPPTSGCTIAGTNTGGCCSTFPITSNATAGSTTCITSSDRVVALRDCLEPLVGGNKDRLMCTGASSGAVPTARERGKVGRTVGMAVVAAVCVAVLAA